MQRKYLMTTAAALVLGAGVFAWMLSRGRADQGNGAFVEGEGKPTVPLPIAQVVLFNSGVGYLQREGEVTGNARVELSFPTGDVNDLLKSMILQDSGGGQIGAISYDAQDPVEKILHSFALDLNGNPTYGQILNQARGEKVDVVRQEKPGSNPFKVAGTIIGMESHRELAGKDSLIDNQQLNLLTADGMLSIPLTQVLSVRFQNQALDSDFRRALQVVAGAHDVQKKTVALQFNGTGKRAVKVGYVLERPIWKTTYRLSIDPAGKLFMQAWAIVENTSDDDWNNVRVVLVSGRPISFRMNLYEPLNIPRPLVEPELFASLRPPVYGGSLVAAPGVEKAGAAALGRVSGGRAEKKFTTNFNGKPWRQVLDWLVDVTGLPLITESYPTGSLILNPARDPFSGKEKEYTPSEIIDRLNEELVAQKFLIMRRQASIIVWPSDQPLPLELVKLVTVNELKNSDLAKSEHVRVTVPLYGMQAEVFAVSVKKMMGPFGQVIPLAEPNQLVLIDSVHNLRMILLAISSIDSAEGSNSGPLARKNLQAEIGAYAKLKGSTIAGLNFKEGVQSIATSQDIGDHFQYVIDQKISLARQKSAMLPILNQTIAGSKVSIFNEAVHAKFPLLGLRLKNTSGKPLTQGPITVYEDNSYAGDTRTLDLQPNEERLLSYAVDQATEVKTTVNTHPATEMTFNIGGNNLTASYSMRQTTTYTLKNRGTHDRTVLIEHPIRGDWKLVDPKKPNDQSRDVYRFQVEVKAGTTVNQDVVEQQMRTDPVALQRGQDVAPFYAVMNGIEIRLQVKNAEDKLLSLSIRQGLLEASYKQVESKTYFLQNNSERDHSFTVDHVIPKEWTLHGEGAMDQVGPDVFTFKVQVMSKKTAHREVVQERVFQDRSHFVLNMDDNMLRQFIAHQTPAANVKDKLQQILDQRTALRTATQKLTDAKADLRILADDQARVRENLKIIPQNSEHFNDFLKKFVAQEAQIEDAQRQIRTQESAVQKMQKELETFVLGATVS